MRLVRAPMLLAVLALLVAGCSSSGTKPSGTVASVVERDFKIRAQRYDLPAGKVDLAVKNDGPEAHELIVVRETDSGLPMRKDGLTVDEDAIEKQTLGALEPGQPGGERHLQLHLAPGRYMLICNMSGHYLGGMHAELAVG